MSPNCTCSVAVVRRSRCLKKFVRSASVFPSPPFRSSDFAGPRRPRLYGFHPGTRSLSNRKGRGRRRGGREREPRRAGVEQCIEPVHQAVHQAVHQSSPSEWAVPRVAGRFSDSETSWVLAGGAEGMPGAAGAKKNCEIGVGFSFAALSVFRLRRAEAVSAVWIPHWHSEPFESQGARAAKRYVNGNLVEREKGDEFGIKLLLLLKVSPTANKNSRSPIGPLAILHPPSPSEWAVPRVAGR